MRNFSQKWMPMAIGSLLIIGLAACSKKDDSASQMTQPNASTGQNTDAQQSANMEEAVKQLKLAQPDKSVGLDQYVPVTSGEMLMYSYYGLSKMPLDTTEIANKLSSDFRQTQDQFKKQDILKVLEPQIKEKVAAHSQNRYFSWMIEDNLGGLIDHYDFQHKVFPIKSKYWDGGYSYYWNDITDFTMGFKAPQSLQVFKVEDEAAARQIEKLLGENERDVKLTIYCFAQDFDLNQKKINSLVTTFELRDSKGNILAKQTM